MKFHSIPLAGTFGAKGRLLGHKFPGFQREEAGFFFETSIRFNALGALLVLKQAVLRTLI